MFLARLLLIYLVLPAVLLLVSSWLPRAARFWFVLAVVPLGLILFAVLRYIADCRTGRDPKPAAAPEQPPASGARRFPEGSA